MNYGEFLGKKMWAFGPARRIAQQQLGTFAAFPPRTASARSNASEMKEELREDGVGQ